MLPHGAAVVAQPLAPVIPTSGAPAARQRTGSGAGRLLPLARPEPVPRLLRQWSKGSAALMPPAGLPTRPSPARWAGLAVTGCP